MKKQSLLFLAACSLLSLSSAIAQTPNATQIRFFEAKIRPALVKYCYECHSVDEGESRGGLYVDSRKALLDGGDAGAALVPGKPEQSILWQAMNWEGYEMPPSEKMPASVIADFKQWIEMGAPDPRERKELVHQTKITQKDIKNGKEHWAFLPLKRSTGVSIDEIVSARLDQEGLAPAPPADASTLLRRINFNLIGLPPTPEEIQAFQRAFQSNADAAVAAKVDELLDRPQYGERWGRHWLDVARYAESSGSRNFSYPHAWRYRDYVIDAFNKDTPYNWFIAQQIAGDLLPAETDEQWQENLVATGFLAIGLKHQDQKNPRKFMADMIDEQIDTTMQAVLGLTVACARCHDHKYDPIPTDDYYAIAGIFHSTNTYYGTTRVGQNHRPSDLLLLPIQSDAPASGRRSLSVDQLKARIAEIDDDMAAMQGKLSRRDEDGEIRKDIKSMRNNRNRLAGQLASMNPDGSNKTFAMGVQEADQVVNANILISGEVEKPAQEVPRGFLQVMGDLNFQVRNNASSGRKELVKAMTSRSNPLTARVMVNRIWMHLLGRPIVATANNFGLSGTEPENPELLDYLAIQFMQENWSIKRVIREIVMSDTYRRSARYDEHNYSVDPDNKLLWRINPRQLDAEALRDAMLSVSGQIDLSRPVASVIASGGGKPGGANVGDHLTSRSVYLPIVRDSVVEPLALFDFPDASMSCGGRNESIVPTQALYMMNGDFAQSQAQSMATNLAKNYSTTDQQIRNAFLWTYGRPATEGEITASLQFFREFKPHVAARPSTTDSLTQTQAPRGRSRGPSQARTGGPRQQRGGPLAMRGGRSGPGAATRTSTPVSNDQTLTVFCQTLLASARFRILN